MLLGYLVIAGFYAIPIAVIVGFFVSLWRYVSAKRQNKLAPETFPKEKIADRRDMLILFSALFVFVLIVVLWIIKLLSNPVAFM